MIFNFTISLDVDQVLRCLGYKHKDDYPRRVREEVERAIGEAREYRQARAICAETRFTVDEAGKRLLLPDGHALCGESFFDRLKQCSFLTVAVGTLGEEVLARKPVPEEDEDKGLRALIGDTIGNLALFELDCRLRRKLAEKYGEQGLRLAACFSPGDEGLGLQAQKVVFALLDTQAIGVDLNEHLMMKPLKTISVLYGIARANAAYETGLNGDCEDRCSSCGLTDCTFRKPNSFRQVVIRTPEAGTLWVPRGQNLYQVLVKQGLIIPNSCGGHHLCGQCMVKIATAYPLPVSEREADLLRQRNAEPGYRLACFLSIDQNMEIWLPEAKKPQVYREGKSKQAKISLNPWDRSRSESGNYGVAVDLGTTTVVLYLLGMQTGRVIDIYSFLNPQRAFGADVISRINYTLLEKKGLEDLHCLIIEGINCGLEDLLTRNGLRQADIQKMAVAGNTAMIHLFLAIPCTNLAKAPYAPVLTSAVKTIGSDLGLAMKHHGQVMVLPGIAAFVGSDTLAAVLASGMPLDNKVNLLLDIGTNGEIVLGNQDMMTCCSTAAGPAFEGGRISCGMGGVGGAIDHVNFDLEEIYTTIYNQAPVGICGSGVVDMVSELLRYGIVDNTGRMKRKPEMSGLLPARLTDRLAEHQGKAAFLLEPKAGIVFTQSDVREFQLAKGAILAGINMLIKKMRLAPDKISRIYLSGGFGNYLNLESAQRVGLFPPGCHKRVALIGNGAGTGVRMALLSDDSYCTLKDIQRRMRYWELSADSEFQAEFIKALDF